MTVHAIQHCTSKRYLVEHFDGCWCETPDEAKASTWDREGAEQAHMALGSFAGAWRIVQLERALSDAEADKMLAALREEGL